MRGSDMQGSTVLELGIIIQLPYSGKFLRGNICVVFNNQIYLWKKIHGLQLSAVPIKP